MGKKTGRSLLLKIGNGAGEAEVFNNFGGMTGKTIKINSERIDATTPDPESPEGTFWRETLDGVKSVSLSGDVTLVEDAAEARIVAVVMSSSAVANFQVIIPGLGTFEGGYSVEVEFGDDGKLTCSMSMESTGEITFTPAV